MLQGVPHSQQCYRCCKRVGPLCLQMCCSGTPLGLAHPSCTSVMTPGLTPPEVREWNFGLGIVSSSHLRGRRPRHDLQLYRRRRRQRVPHHRSHTCFTSSGGIICRLLADKEHEMDAGQAESLQGVVQAPSVLGLHFA